ncbi:DUF3800 domain-containing protein [Corallococcus interemptor]|uniref:hypothetical protein n=1 Tax=Corallococcus interemptor TaxID=2316720 RepID=UPI0035D3FD0D
MSNSLVRTLYSDESGGTGADLFETKQPFAVTCLILLSSEQEHELEAVVADLRNKNRDLLQREMKFQKLGKTTMGLKVVRAVGQSLLSAGARIYFGITEKRYLACHLLVETFLDVDLNPSAPLESERPGWRRWLTNKVFDAVPDQLLMDLQSAIRSDDPEATRRVGESLVWLLKLHPDSRVTESWRMVESGLGNVFRYGLVRPDAPPRSERPTPAVTEFAIMLRAISQDLGGRGEVARIVSDTDRQFGESLSFSLMLAKSDERDDAHYTFAMPGPATQLLERMEVSSESSLGVQVADIGAGIISRMAGDTCRALQLDPKLLDAWEPFLALAKMNPEYLWWRVSEKSLRMLMKPFAGTCPRLDPF